MSNSEPQLFGGNWTEKKLAILEGYLKAYNTALKHTRFTRVYVDAFAGSGYRQQARRDAGFDIFQEIEEAETVSFLKGSAKLALEVDPPFDKYVFIESDPVKVAELERLGQEHPDKAGSIDVHRGDANAWVQEYCRSMGRDERAVEQIKGDAPHSSWRNNEVRPL